MDGTNQEAALVEAPAKGRAERQVGSRTPNQESFTYGRPIQKVKWREGKVREFIIGGLAYCVAYCGDEQRWMQGVNKPSRLLRLKGACLVTGYTGTLQEFRRRENQPIYRVGARITGEESKSTVEDICQEIENLTRYYDGQHRKHLTVRKAFAQRHLTADEYLWITAKVNWLQSTYPTPELMAAAAENYAKQIELVFEGARLDPAEEATLEFSGDLILKAMERGLTESEARKALHMLGCHEPTASQPDLPSVDVADASDSTNIDAPPDEPSTDRTDAPADDDTLL
jgi:hypothetical protein